MLLLVVENEGKGGNRIILYQAVHLKMAKVALVTPRCPDKAAVETALAEQGYEILNVQIGRSK